MIIGQRNTDVEQPIQRTTKPIVTGSSVIALTFNGGVILATDTLCSYYGMRDFKNVKRVEKISDSTILSSTGDFSDFQEVVRLLGEKSKEAFLYDDGVKPTPRDYANFLARQSYNKRNKSNPLFLHNVVAGFHGGQRYLGQIDLYGTYVEAKFVTTGFANHFCRSVVTNYWREDSTEEQARQLLIECFKVLFCRDARAHDHIQIAVVDANGVRIDEPIEIQAKWDFAGYRNKANELLHTQ